MDPGIPSAPPPSSSDYDVMNQGDMTKQVCCIKYSLMACNAFGIMMGIFVVLFGMSYPEENFPGGYNGKSTAGIAGFFIVFTLIGYYGAHRQKIYFLLPYSIIIFLFLGGNLMMWGIKPVGVTPVLDPDSNAVLVLAGVFIVLMVSALWLAWEERKKGTSNVSVTSSMGTYPLTTMTAPITVPPPQQQVTQPQQVMGMQPQQQMVRPQQSSVTFGPYGPRPPGAPIPFDIDSKIVYDPPPSYPLNVYYQPETNSYVTLPVGPRYPGLISAREARARAAVGGSGGFIGGGPLLMW